MFSEYLENYTESSHSLLRTVVWLAWHYLTVYFVQSLQLYKPLFHFRYKFKPNRIQVRGLRSADYSIYLYESKYDPLWTCSTYTIRNTFKKYSWHHLRYEIAIQCVIIVNMGTLPNDGANLTLAARCVAAVLLFPFHSTSTPIPLLVAHSTIAFRFAGIFYNSLKVCATSVFA